MASPMLPVPAKPPVEIHATHTLLDLSGVPAVPMTIEPNDPLSLSA